MHLDIPCFLRVRPIYDRYVHAHTMVVVTVIGCQGRILVARQVITSLPNVPGM